MHYNSPNAGLLHETKVLQEGNCMIFGVRLHMSEHADVDATTNTSGLMTRQVLQTYYLLALTLTFLLLCQRSSSGTVTNPLCSFT